MPTVPYSGVPSVAPQFDATPRYVADVSPATFGGNVAQAIQGLGQVTDKAGDEVFARATAMQTLHNHSVANDAVAQYTQLAGQKEIDFKLNQGKAAVDAYPAYQKDLADLRQSTRDGIDSPEAQRLFDTESRRTFTALTLSGATHTATQNKNFAIESSDARKASIGQLALANPQDDVSFQAGLAQTRAETVVQSQIQHGAGPDDDITKQAVSAATTSLWAQRIQGMVKTQPVQAGKLLAGAIAKGEVSGDAVGKLQNIVTQAQNTVGARVISQSVATGANGRWGQGPVDLASAREAIGQIESQGNYSLTGVQTRHGIALGKYQVMSDFLPDYLARAGLPAMTPAEFLKNPKAQDAVFDASFGANMAKTGSANDAASMWFTGKPLAEAVRSGVTDATETYKGIDAKTYVNRFNGALAQGAPLSARVEMAKQMAAEQAPDNPLLPDYAEQRVLADHSAEQRIRTDDVNTASRTVAGALLNNEGGTAPSTVEQLTHSDPQVAAAWQKLGELDPRRQNEYYKILARNAKGDVPESADTLRLGQQYKGMAQNDPAGFLQLDIPTLPLPITDRKALINLQDKVQANAGKDPGVTTALSILKPTLDSAGLTRKDKPKDFDQFTGALRDAMHQFATDNKRQPKDEEVMKMGARLLQTTGPAGWWSPAPQVFNAPIPSDILAATRSKRPDLSDEEIQRQWTRHLYRDLTNTKPMSETRPEDRS